MSSLTSPAIQQKKPTLAFHQADYRDDEILRNILSLYHKNADINASVGFRISGVIHFAVSEAVAESFQKPLRYYENNVSGVILLCSTLGKFGIKNLVLSSSVGNGLRKIGGYWWTSV